MGGGRVQPKRVVPSAWPSAKRRARAGGEGGGG